MDYQDPRRENHTIQIDNRAKIVITDVKDVETFNEENIKISLKSGGMFVKGSNLHIQKLDLEEGKVIITGHIDQMAYTEKKAKKEGSLLGRIFK